MTAPPRRKPTERAPLQALAPQQALGVRALSRDAVIRFISIITSTSVYAAPVGCRVTPAAWSDASLCRVLSLGILACGDTQVRFKVCGGGVDP